MSAGDKNTGNSNSSDIMEQIFGYLRDNLEIQVGGSMSYRGANGWSPNFGLGLQLVPRRSTPPLELHLLQEMLTPRLPQAGALRAIEPSPPSHFKIGDNVYVHVKENDFKRLQKQSGTWNPNMERVIGKQGIVVNENVGGKMIIVDFSEGRWSLDPRCCSLSFPDDETTAFSNDSVPDGAEDETGEELQFKAVKDFMANFDVTQPCPGCKERPKRLIFKCRHGACRECGATLDECPKCGARITETIRLS